MATSNLPAEVITPKSLYTITGAAAVVWLFGAVLYTILGQRMDEVFYRAIGFGLSFIIAIGMLIEKKKYKLTYWLLVIPNAALIFINASGFNAVNTGSNPIEEADTKTEEKSASIQTSFESKMQKAAFLPFLKDAAWWPDPTLNEKIEQLKKVNESLVVENKTIKNQIAENTGDAADKQKIAFLEDQVKLLQTENEALKKGNNNEDLTTAIAGLKKDLTDKTNQLRICNSDLQKTKNELTSANNQLNACLKNGNSNTALNDRITSLTNQLNQAKNSLAGCEDKLKNAETQIGSLKKQLANCKNNPGDPDGSPVVIDLRNKISSLEKELLSLKNKLPECQTALAQANSRSSGNDQTAMINDLKSKLNSYSSELEKCNSELRRYQSYYKTCTGQLGMVRDSLNRCLNPKQVIKTQIPKGQ